MLNLTNNRTADQLLTYIIARKFNADFLQCKFPVSTSKGEKERHCLFRGRWIIALHPTDFDDDKKSFKVCDQHRQMLIHHYPGQWQFTIG